MSCQQVTENNKNEFLQSFDTVLVDCDGVLWHGTVPIPGASDALTKFRKMGKKVFFVTNNSSKTRQEFLGKFHSLRFEASKEDIYCTAYAAASYLKALNFNRKVYVVGSKGITQELEKVGIEHLGSGPDIMQGNMIEWIMRGVKLDSDVGAVIVGFDENISFPKILKAVSYLNNPECIFLATNTDERFPVGNTNVVVPGSGSMVSAVQTSAERSPVVLGKPSRYLFEAIQHDCNDVKPERTIMIGDRLNTDILMGFNCGLKTLLVLTGVSTLDDVQRYESSSNPKDKSLVPNYYISSLGNLFDEI